MPCICGFSSSGSAPPCQGGGSEFEPRKPLQKRTHICLRQVWVLFNLIRPIGRDKSRFRGMKSLRDEIRLRREIRTDFISSAKQISSERSEESFPHKIATGEKCALAITGWDATNLCKPSRRHQGAALRNPSSFFNIQLKIPRQNRSPFSSRDEYIICFTHRHTLHGTTRLTRGFRYIKKDRPQAVFFW